jgi:hypothetical protein
MTWLQPWAVWFLAGLPVIILLYMLKVRRRAATLSTLIFWQHVVQEHRRRALFQRLRSFFSLLLHLIIFALIVAALARPTLDRLAREGASTVIVLDVRARMQAIEPDGETRFAKAVRGALASISEASPSRQFAVLAAGPHATVLSPFSGNERALLESVEKLDATDAGGSLDEALALAEDLVATRIGARQIVLFTDRPLPDTIAAQHPLLVVRAVGTSRENAGITLFAARPLPASPSTSEVLLEVRNFGHVALKTSLELRYDDHLLDVKPLTLDPGGSQTLVFSSVPRPSASARGHFTATLDTTDALSLDNIARVWLPPPRPVRVLLITNGNVFLEKALSADAGVSYELLAPDAWNESIAAKFDVVILDDFVPAARPIASTFYIKRSPFDAGSALDQPVLTEVDATHPTLRLLDFTHTTILRAQPLELPAPDTEWTYAAPLRSFDHAILVVGEKRPPNSRRVAALGLDLSATDLPLRIAFPLLVTNTVHWLAGGTAKAPVAFRAGEGGMVKNGFFPIDHDGRTEWIAVNTFDENESDLSGPSASASAPIVSSSLRNALTPMLTWPLWRYLAIGDLALFTLEWSLFHRRRTE